MSADRFFLLDPGEVRSGRVPLPPAFAVKAMTDDTEGRFSLLEVTVPATFPDTRTMSPTSASTSWRASSAWTSTTVCSA
jgi:hypothetical protein